MSGRQHCARAPATFTSSSRATASATRPSKTASGSRTGNTGTPKQDKLTTKSQQTPTTPAAASRSPTTRQRVTSEPSTAVEELSSRFEQLTSSVLALASSPRALGARSLDNLLTREIADHLGPGLYSPSTSQRFIQATRGLLDNLVCLYEEGKLNPHLLGDQKPARQQFLTAKSSTNICYRDKYLKELLMNVLKSMCSNELEEEVSTAGVQVSSAASRERVLAIRDIVRAEAGLEPETFRELDRKLAELRRAMSQSRLEMMRAAMEVERIISEQCLSHESSKDCVNIPGAAREALRQGSDRQESRATCGSEEGRSSDENNNCVTPNNSFNSESVQSQVFVPSNVQEPMDNIKPYIEEIVQKELSRAKEKKRRLLNRGRFTVEAVSSRECASSAENLDVEDDVEDDEDDDEISEEETRMFLEALKFDMQQRRHMTPEIISECLEPIDEDEDDVVGRKNMNVTVECRNDSINSSGRILEVNGNEQFDLPPTTDCLERIQSIRWSSDDNMREVFQKLKYIPENILSPGLCVNRNERALYNKDKVDLTVDEVEKILKNLAVKIEQMPVFFQSSEFSMSKEQQQQLFAVLTKLGVRVHGAHLNEDDALQCLSRNEQFLSSLLSASKSFSFLSKALHSASDQVRGYPFSALTPPSSLTTTLAFLASSEHFKDCFTTVLDKDNMFKLGIDFESDTGLKEPFMSDTEQNTELIGQSVADTKSSHIISPPVDVPEESVKVKVIPYALRNACQNDAEDIDRHISSFEHFLGLTPSVMTVQNISDMFIYLSSVLNEVPDRMKRERIASLNPPSSFLRAVDLLYDDDTLSETDKRTSFHSLTVQDVSNFFLTISKALQDMPGRVRHSSIMEMDPPKSLLKAINLLTSLSHISILECHSEEEVYPQEQPLCQDTQDKERPQSSHESFFDAVDSLTSLRPLSR